MARRPNYGFERWRRETQKREARDAKRLEKKERGGSGAGPEMGEAAAAGPAPGVWEWFSPSRNRVATSEIGGRPAAAEPPDDWILLTETAPSAEGPAT
jgi:hypothetical protein